MPAKKKLSQKVDKRYRGRVRIGVDGDGSPLYKYISGRTKAELEAAREDMEQRYISGSYVKKEMTFGEYAPRWLEIYKTKKSSATYEMYESTLRVHLLPVLGQRQMRAVMPTDLQKLLNTKTSMSESSIDKIRLTMKQIFKRATADYIIDRDPSMALELPRGTSNERRALTQAEANAALRVAESHPQGMLLLLLYYLGLRKGEALGLYWSDIDWDARTIHIQRKIDHRPGGDDRLKTLASYRHVPIPSPLLDALFAARGDADGYILPGDRIEHLCKASYTRVWAQMMVDMAESSGIETRPLPKYLHGYVGGGKNARMSVLTAHYFRHNYATLLYQANVPLLTASYWLGHSDIKMTAQIYTHLDQQKASKDVRLLNDFLIGNG